MINIKKVIKETIVRDLVQAKLQNTSLFLVDVKVRPGNKIVVFADGEKGITVDECADISKYIESKLNREIEDYELEVSSPGITQPLKVEKQYRKNLGKQVHVLMKDGIKKCGTLLNYDNIGFQIEEKIKIKGKEEITVLSLLFSEIKETKLLITFKK
jgi:ribosome maturation factor RimP